MARLLNDQNQCIRASTTLIVHLITDQHYHATAASHYTHSLSVTFLCPPPRLPPRTGFYSAHRTCPCVSAPRGQ